MPHSRQTAVAKRTTEDLLRRADSAVANSVKAMYYPMAVREAHNYTVVDVEGRSYLDFHASWTAAGIGYSNPEVAKAVKQEVDRTAGLATGTYPVEVTTKFAEKLIEITPGKFPKKVLFGHSGSDACDAPFKVIPQVTKRHRMLSFYGSMHGVDVGGMAMAGHPATSKYPIPTLATKIPYAYCYRCPFMLQYPSCGIHCASDFIEDNVFKSINPPEDTAFMIVEAIQSDSGDVVPPPGYLEKLKKTCDKHGILFVVDEVKVGLGRTGKMFGIDHSMGVVPDGLSLGKALGSGLPVGAFVARKELVDPGFAYSTLVGNAVGAAAGLATIEFIEENKLPDNAARVGGHLLKLLNEMMSRHPLIGDVRGKGLIVGVELVKDRKTKEPAHAETAKLVYRAWQLGLITVYFGSDGNVIEITPPLTITEDAVVKGAEIIERALVDVEKGLVADSAIEGFTGF